MADSRVAPERQPSPLSARQRDAQRAAMINQINATTLQVNALTKHVERNDRYFEEKIGGGDRLLAERLDKRIDSLATQQGATFNSLTEFCGRSFWQRLRWLVTGR